jgi:hypothetical protein
MSETVAETVAPEPAEAAAPAAPEPKAHSASEEPSETFDAAYVKKLRAEAAKYRTEAKELAGKAQKFDEITESQKSELQKAQEAAQRAEQELEQARTEMLRTKVAAAKGLPASIADRLRGSTAEEMEADADAMLAEIEKQYVAKQGASREATGAGVTGKSGIDSLSPADMVRMTRERRGS